MNVIYLSTFLPPSKRESLTAKMKNYNFNSADAFSFSVFSGLSKITDINLSVVNVPPLGAFPRFNSLFYSSACYEKVQGINIHSIANCNLIAYQYYSVYRNTLKTLNNVASVLALSHHESTPVVTTVDPTIVPIPFSSNCMIPFSFPSVYVQYPM